MINLAAIRVVWFSSLLGFSASLVANSPGVETTYLKPTRLGVDDFHSTGTGRGVQTLVDRVPGDALLKVPVNETITASNDHSKSSERSWEQFSEEQKLSLHLLHLKKKNHPYVCTVFPSEHFSIWTLPQNVFDTRPMSLLPRCYRESFQASRDMTLTFAKAIEEEFEVDDVMWALSMVRSRSIAVPELAENDGQDMPLALIPGLDLLNHQFDSGSLLLLVDDHWTLTSSKSYKAGDQIFLSYGDDKDNLKLLLTYGFAVKNNPNSVAFWTWEDLLDAAGAVRPAMFSEQIRRSLMRHPQLKVYISLTEERATFSLDTKTKLPRESLQNGLLMLSSLATQLGFPEDEALQQDVLDSLLKSRVEELGICLKSFQKSSDHEALPESWMPLMSSVKLVIEEELSDLAR
jgi:hypothetical protein